MTFLPVQERCCERTGFLLMALIDLTFKGRLPGEGELRHQPLVADVWPQIHPD